MMELLDPTTEAATQAVAYAPRPGTLAGKRVALIDNTKFNSDTLLVRIGDILVKEHGAAGYQMWHKKNASVPAHEEIIQEVRKTCDVMVAGIGD